MNLKFSVGLLISSCLLISGCAHTYNVGVDVNDSISDVSVLKARRDIIVKEIDGVALEREYAFYNQAGYYYRVKPGNHQITILYSDPYMGHIDHPQTIVADLEPGQNYEIWVNFHQCTYENQYEMCAKFSVVKR